MDPLTEMRKLAGITPRWVGRVESVSVPLAELNADGVSQMCDQGNCERCSEKGCECACHKKKPGKPSKPKPKKR